MNVRTRWLLCLAALLCMPGCKTARVDGETGTNRGTVDQSAPADRAAEGDGRAGAGRPRVVVLSIDGCRFDYLADETLAHLGSLVDAGASATAVEVTNPSMSAPGHVTLITGAWSDTHGIVFNKFYDREAGFVKFFGGIPPEEQTSYLLAEPLWATAAAAGLRTAAVHWAATAGEYEGRSVDWAAPFDSSWSNQERVAEGVRMLEEHDPDLLLIYTTGVSPASYAHGPGSDAVHAALLEMDGLVGELQTAIQASDRAAETTLVVVSDHGFGPPATQELCLSWLLADAGIGTDFVLWGAIGQLFLEDPADAEQAAALIAPLEGVNRVVPRSEADSLHLATKNRTGDLLVVTNPGYQVANMWRPCDGPIVDVQEDYLHAGAHGYPAAEVPEMRGIFVAAGPQVGHTDLGVIRQVDIAPTLATLLGIPPPAQADGESLELPAAR